MSVSDAYRHWALEQLGRVVPVTSRSMFGGVGIYADGVFFALIDDDTLYFKVGDGNRGAFEAAGMTPFRPYGDERTMQYYAVPQDVLEDADQLRDWVEPSVAVARAARRRGAPTRRGGRPHRPG
jgi:DNA transformation protein and related proteins